MSLFRSDTKLRKHWECTWIGQAFHHEGTLSALEEYLRDTNIIISAQLIGADKSSHHNICIVSSNASGKDACYLIDSNEEYACAMTQATLAAFTDSVSCTGWRALLVFKPSQKLLQSKGRIARQLLQH